MLRKSKRSWLCKMGFHKFKTVTETNGYIDCGEVILRNEETQIICTRDGCNKTNGRKDSKWVKFKKKD